MLSLIWMIIEIFLYSYEAEFIHSLLSLWKTSYHPVQFTYMYIDDLLSITQTLKLSGHMYPIELENEDTTYSNTSASYLD